MGIRDMLRSLRGGEKKASTEDETDVEAPEPTWFQPRFDGSYDATGTEAGGSGLRLRFLPGGSVFESDGTAGTEQTPDIPAPDQPDPRRGEYTGAGRFNVQRRFERIVSYAVLEMEAGPTQDQPGFLARRIDAADRTMAELHFLFRPDGT